MIFTFKATFLYKKLILFLQKNSYIIKKDDNPKKLADT